MGITVKKSKVIDAVPVVATIEKSYKDNTQTTEDIILGESTNPQATASVSVGVGLTKNLGNYESVKISISLTVPCLPTEDDIEETYTNAKNWVDTKVNEINDEIESAK